MRIRGTFPFGLPELRPLHGTAHGRDGGIEQTVGFPGNPRFHELDPSENSLEGRFLGIGPSGVQRTGPLEAISWEIHSHGSGILCLAVVGIGIE